MNYLQRSFLASVKACDESTLMLSRKDCHQLGLDSIVIENNDGRLTRAFFAHEHHRMWENINISKPSLGIHDHKYDLRLTGLCGNSFNITAKVLLHKKGMFMYKYSPEWVGGIGLNGKAIPCSLEVVSRVEIGVVDIPSNTLHTVMVPVNKKAAWIVEEGTLVKQETTLITNIKREDFNLSGLYSPFKSKDEIISMVETFLK